jgi:hypothetical protein
LLLEHTQQLCCYIWQVTHHLHRLQYLHLAAENTTNPPSLNTSSPFTFQVYVKILLGTFVTQFRGNNKQIIMPLRQI